MTDKELIRRALMGSQEAQQACTDKGIALPCPKCFSDGVRIEGDAHNIYDPDTLGYIDSIPDSILYVTCDNCNLCSNCITVKDGEEREDAEKRLIAEWNTRPAPPVGRCKDCVWSREPTKEDYKEFDRDLLSVKTIWDNVVPAFIRFEEAAREAQESEKGKEIARENLAYMADKGDMPREIAERIISEKIL